MQIQLTNLVKTFGDKTAVNIPSFRSEGGEIIGLVGNNGAGKTTLFRLLLDLLNADKGCVSLTFDMSEADVARTKTFDPAQTEDWKLYTGAYLDEAFLIDFLTPEEYFDFIGMACEMSHDTLKARLDGFEQFMGGEILGQNKLIRDFSAGNKQKVGIVAAMLNTPQLLILDEPFNFLDPSSQNILKKILTEYNQQHGATILLSSHNLQHTVDISSRIALLEHGVIIKDLPNEGGSADTEIESYFSR